MHAEHMFAQRADAQSCRYPDCHDASAIAFVTVLSQIVIGETTDLSVFAMRVVM